MVKRLEKFELPTKLVKINESNEKNYACFIAEPFESGYGYTIGNAFRRILLSSIEGSAISSIKINKISHEFQGLDGIVEDITEIILNLKKIIILNKEKTPTKLLINVNKEGSITAADIDLTEFQNITILNSEAVICTLSKKMNFNAELIVTTGRGYHSSDENNTKSDKNELGLIPIDCVFSPVTHVKYSIENTRVGQMTNYDKLLLEIWTDGRITPDEALKDATSIFKLHLNVFDKIIDEKREFQNAKNELSEEKNRLYKLLNMSVNEIELSVRAANCLNNANITNVGELCMKSEAEMLKYRNFGKKSLNEIKKKLEQLSLSLGMNIDKNLINKKVNNEA